MITANDHLVVIASHDTEQAQFIDSMIWGKDPTKNESLIRLIADYYYCTLTQAREYAYKQWATRHVMTPLFIRMRATVSQNNARCRCAGIAGYISPVDWFILCESHHNQCVLCGEKRPLTIDHIQPLSKSGLNMIANIQPVCVSCNSRKGNRT